MPVVSASISPAIYAVSEAKSVYASQYVGNAQNAFQGGQIATTSQAINYMIDTEIANGGANSNTWSTITVYYMGKVKPGDKLVIPIVAISQGTGAITATVNNQGIANITNQNINVSTAGGQGVSVTTPVDTSVDANYRMWLSPVTIQEITPGQIRNGIFYIDAPVGYHFTNTGTAASGAQPISVSTTSTLIGGSITCTNDGWYAWRKTTDMPTDTYSYPDPYWPTTPAADGKTVVYPSSSVLAPTSPQSWNTANNQQLYYPSAAGSRLYFRIANMTNIAVANAQIVISGLVIAQDDPTQAPYNNQLHLTAGDNLGNVGSTLVAALSKDGTWDLPIAARQAWGISFDTTVPGTVVNAISGWVNMANVSPWANNVASAAMNPLSISNPIDVTFQESTINSWWLARNTVFSLVDANGNPLPQVKFSQFRATTTNITPGFDTTLTRSSLVNPTTGTGSRFNSSGSTNMYFSSDDSSVTLYDLTRSAQNDKAAVELRFYLSADPAFSGPVYLAVNSDAISTTTINQTKVQIANFTQPVTIATSTTNIQIGYQNYAVANVDITETQPGILQSGKNMSLYLGEYGDGLQTPYMYFGPVTAANMSTDASSMIGISSMAITGGYANTGANGTLTNRIDLSVTTRALTPASSADTATYTPATISLKNLIVNVDRNTPQGNYDFIVGGPAVTNNANYGIDSGVAIDTVNPQSYTDCFPTMGVVYQNYLTVATPGANVPFSDRVVVTPGSSTALVGPADKATSYDMTVNAFIDDQTNRLMVPIRFVSTALGVDPLNVRWDGTSGTATIWTNEKVISFVEGSSVMTINNTPFQLMNSDGTPVIPQIYTASDGSSRMFIPFTALGQAIGIQVVWDATDGYAIYNPTPDELAAYPTSTVTTTAATTDTSSTDTTAASTTTSGS